MLPIDSPFECRTDRQTVLINNLPGLHECLQHALSLYVLSAFRSSQNRARTNMTTTAFHKYRKHEDKCRHTSCIICVTTQCACAVTYFCCCHLSLIALKSPIVWCDITLGKKRKLARDSARAAAGCTTIMINHKIYPVPSIDQIPILTVLSFCGSLKRNTDTRWQGSETGRWSKQNQETCQIIVNML